jgi:hypothetical protein
LQLVFTILTLRKIRSEKLIENIEEFPNSDEIGSSLENESPYNLRKLNRDF